MFSRNPYRQHWILNVSFTITTLFSGTPFAATDIFFEVIKTGTVIKELRGTIFTMPHELYLLFKISIKLCHFFFSWTNQFSWYKTHKILRNLTFLSLRASHRRETILVSWSAVSHIGLRENKIHDMFDLASSQVVMLTVKDKGILLPWRILNVPDLTCI